MMWGLQSIGCDDTGLLLRLRTQRVGREVYLVLYSTLFIAARLQRLRSRTNERHHWRAMVIGQKLKWATTYTCTMDAVTASSHD